MRTLLRTAIVGTTVLASGLLGLAPATAAAPVTAAPTGTATTRALAPDTAFYVELGSTAA